MDEKNLTHGTYGAALFDPRWKSKRKEILERDRNKCIHCMTEQKLQVHHRQYHFSKMLNEFMNPWDYDNSLLITLCENCHQKGHRLYQVPVKQIK